MLFDWRIDKIWYIQTIGKYSSTRYEVMIKLNKIGIQVLPNERLYENPTVDIVLNGERFNATWINKCTMLSERCQMERTKYCVVQFI
jgi:hypothetical protein